MDTFVVRGYRSGADADDDRLRGIVEDITSGLTATFHDTNELLSILHREQREQPEVSPGSAETPGVLVTARPDPGGVVHRRSQSLPTKGAI